MGIFSDIGGALTSLSVSAGDALEGVGGMIGIGPEATSEAQPAYEVNAASFEADPAYQQERQMLRREIYTPQVGPSPAELLMRQESEKIGRQAAGQMASQRGVNPSLAAQSAATLATNARMDASGKAGVLRAQESTEAKALREQQRQTYLGAMESERQAQITREGMQSGAYQAAAEQQFQAEESSRDRSSSFISGIGQGATTAAMFAASDRNSKKNISDGANEVRSFLDALEAKTYEYKNGKQPGANGERLGVIAQDIEKTPMDYMVIDTDKGKQIDYGQGFGAILAALADMHGRVKELEGRGK